MTSTSKLSRALRASRPSGSLDAGMEQASTGPQAPEPVLLRPADPLGGAAIPSEVQSQLGSRPTGRALPAAVAGAMEHELQRDLSAVRVHTGTGADRLARSVQAVAFTHGPDIFFAGGAYAPGTADGSHLLAHELAHVSQGTAGPGPVIGRADDPAEAAADRVADRIAPALRRSAQLPAPAPGHPLEPGAPATAVPGPEGLRRRISATSADINALRSSSGVKKGARTKDSLDSIGRLLDQLAKLVDEREMIATLTAIVALCDQFLAKHTDPVEKPKIMLVEDIMAEARRDQGQLKAQLRYINDARASEPPGRGSVAFEPTKTPLTQQLNVPVKKAAGLANARFMEFSDNMPRPWIDLVKQAGLTEAEILAIKTFSGADFLYLNPAVANSRVWMANQRAEVQSAMSGLTRFYGERQADTQKLVEEGTLHAGVMMQAMGKLPPIKGKVYRGARMSQQEFDDMYGTRREVTYTSFVSLSTNPAVGQRFAATGGAARKPRIDQNLQVYCILEVDDARDIHVLSEIPTEEEWLLLPGSTFAITSVTVSPIGERGKLTWITVQLKQTKPKSNAKRPMPTVPAAPGRPAQFPRHPAAQPVLPAAQPVLPAAQPAAPFPAPQLPQLPVPPQR